MNHQSSADEHCDLAALRADVVEVLRHGGGSRPDVLLVRLGDRMAILKDQNGCDAAFARLIGPILIWREARALRRLHDLPGVPRLLARPDRRSILMEYIPAAPITRARHEEWPAFFSSLERLLRDMHRRGVAHGDLRSPGNTLVSDTGQPVLVDFVASALSGRWNPLEHWVFGLLAQVDRKAVIKLKSIVAPELVAPEERHLLTHTSAVHRVLRSLGIGIRRVSRRLFTGSS